MCIAYRFSARFHFPHEESINCIQSTQSMGLVVSSNISDEYRKGSSDWRQRIYISNLCAPLLLEALDITELSKRPDDSKMRGFGMFNSRVDIRSVCFLFDFTVVASLMWTGWIDVELMIRGNGGFSVESLESFIW